ncbi:MAG: translation initiation factor IF-3 [Bacteroidia bacterium]
MKLAQEKGLDLVEISPQAEPPVVKILDYKKFMFDLKKKRKEQKANQPQTTVKELRFGPNIGDHDLETKMSKARKFLEEGNKLKTFVQFRGRNIIYKDRGREVLEEIAQRLSSIAKIESRPKMYGRRMVMMLSPED